MLKVDDARGELADAIGELLKQSGRDDSSGARRAAMNAISEGEFELAAGYIGCDAQQVRNLYFKHGDVCF